MIETYISNIFRGTDRAYIYIWFSKIHQVIYVGMTNDRVGTLGRASSHMNQKGTLRANFLSNTGISIDNTTDFKLLTFLLPQKKEYISVERSYREAVERLVETELRRRRTTLTPTFEIISWTRNSPRTGNAEVQEIAGSIVQEFLGRYPTL